MISYCCSGNQSELIFKCHVFVSYKYLCATEAWQSIVTSTFACMVTEGLSIAREKEFDISQKFDATTAQF